MFHDAHSDTIVTVTVPSQRYIHGQHSFYVQRCIHYRAEYFRHDVRILRGTHRKETQQA